MLALWVEFFEDLQHVRGRSRNTVMAYRRDLEIYEQYVQHRSDLSGFCEFLKQRKLSARSQARAVSSVRTYLKFCELNGQKIFDLSRFRPPKVHMNLPKAITTQDFMKLYEACEVKDPLKSARNQITLLLLFGLGCRVSELITLDLSHFCETERWLKIYGKGNKERLVPLTEQLAVELKAYLIHIRPHLLGEATQSVLVNDRGHRPSRVDIWRWLAAWSARAGFNKPISPHKFRHGCATSLLESGADLRSIQMLLGHASIQSTQIYTSVATPVLTETVLKYHPLQGLKDI